MLIFMLVPWGVLIDLVALFLMPLLGFCGGFDRLIPEEWVSCSSTSPSDQQLIWCYLAGMFGAVRTLAGLFPDQLAIWFGCMASMLIEVALTAQFALRGQHPDPL